MTDTKSTRGAGGTQMPQPTPDNPFPTPWPTGPTYDEFHLLGEVVARFELQGQLPPESVPKDIEGAVSACRQLLRALGLRPLSMLCAVCGAGAYCWVHDQPARDRGARAVAA